jgi:hypothetical protein
VSATPRGTVRGAPGLFDRAVEISRGEAEATELIGAVALQGTPPSFFDVAAQGLPEELALGSTFFLGDALRLPE